MRKSMQSSPSTILAVRCKQLRMTIRTMGTSSLTIFVLLSITLISACGGGSTSTGVADQSRSQYILPYISGSAFVVGQGNSTNGSHQAGSDQAFAYDFDMPIGTTIIASRSGTVIEAEERFGSNDNTPGRENFIIIQHSDNSVAGYYHLARNGALVALGSNVAQGSPIAISGNLGDSTEPHLHFEVLACRGCNTIPVNFQNTRSHPAGLVEGESYQAEKKDLSIP